MNISIKINGIERKEQIDYRSVMKTDILTSQPDLMTFVVKNVGPSDWTPNVGEEIEMTIDSAKEFAGYIIEVQETTEGGGLICYKVDCKDYTHEMDRQMVVKSYSKQTVNDIIADINTDYLDGFTLTNVNCPITIDYIAFNYEQPSKCLQKLAELVNYDWYVDYDKDIHFFSRLENTAPFNIEDNDGHCLKDTLTIEEDLTRLKNAVYVRGGEYVATERTEKFISDGEQTTFNLAYKYSQAPTIKINDVVQTVGADGLYDFADGYDVLWNYNLRYVRLETAITEGLEIEITGTPLFPVLALVYNEESLAQYGVFMDRIIDKSIMTKQAARERANAELDAYSMPLKYGEFQTYESGLRSGQYINIQSELRDIDETFLINKVIMRMVGPNKIIWSIYVSSIKPLGIIDFLQELFLEENKKIVIDKDEILELVRNVHENLKIKEEIIRESATDMFESIQIAELIRRDPFVPEWVLGHYVPTNDDDNKRMGRLDYTFYLY